MLRRQFIAGDEKPDFIITYYAPKHVPFFGGIIDKNIKCQANPINMFPENLIFDIVLDEWKDGIGSWGIKLINSDEQICYFGPYYYQDTDVAYIGDVMCLVDFKPGQATTLVDNRDIITDIIIPEGIVYVSGNIIFTGIDRTLQNVTFPNSLKYISNCPLLGLTQLKTITIPENVICIKNAVTQINDTDSGNGHRILENVIIKPVNPPEVLGDKFSTPFGNLDNFRDINPNLKFRVYADCIDTYKNDAVWGQYNELYDTINNIICYTTKSGNKISAFISIDFPNSTQILQNDRWLLCTQEPIVNLPAEFRSNSDLNTIALPNSIISIEENAFDGSSLNSIRLGNNLKTIGQYCFRDSSLNEIVIPSSVTTIGKGAFWYCYLLSSITVDDNNLIYDSRNNCNAIIETATNTLILGCDNTIIPNSVTNIGSNAFTGCKNLTSIVIPSSVTSIGDRAFNSCNLLTSVSINSDAIVNKDYLSSASLFSIFGTQVTEYIIGEGITRIGKYVFYNCSSLTSIVIPDGVMSIGDRAFKYCSSLTSITFNGTKAQWEGINLGEDWNYRVPATVIHCTDGDVTIK